MMVAMRRLGIIAVTACVLLAGCGAGGSGAVDTFHAKMAEEGVTEDTADAMAATVCAIDTPPEAAAFMKTVYLEGKNPKELLAVLTVVHEGVAAHCPERREVWAGLASFAN